MKINHKFKVGDKVRFISKDSPNAKYFRCPIDNLEIKQINGDGYNIYDNVYNEDWFVTGEELELITETYKYEVVHTETQEQWDFVLTKIKNTVNNTSKGFISYKEESGLNINSGSQADIPWWRETYKENIKIYLFEEWLDKFGHKSGYLKQNQKEEQWIPQVGDWIYFMKDFDGKKAGHIAKITAIEKDNWMGAKAWIAYENHGGFRWEGNGYFINKDFRKALPHEIPTQELSKEDLLAEAKRRFPIGTKYWNLNRAGGKSVPDNTIKELPVIGKNWKFEIADTDSIDGTDIIVVRDKEGMTHGWVYAKNTWAEIVEEPKVTEKSDNFVLPKKWYCKRTKENSKILNNWNNEKYDSYAFCEKGEGCMFSDKNYTGVDLTNYGKYKEISFEQFTKHVLNKSEVVKEKSWKEVSVDMIKSTGNLPFKVTGYDEPVTKKLTNSKILPIKVRNSNITESTELPKRTRIKIIKKQLLTI